MVTEPDSQIAWHTLLPLLHVQDMGPNITLDVRRENRNLELGSFWVFVIRALGVNMSSRQITRSDIHFTNPPTGMWVPSLPP